MLQAIKFDIFLYVNDICLVYEHEDINEIVDNTLSMHFGEKKRK